MPPSAPFALVSTGPPPPVASYNPQYADPTAASLESYQRVAAAAASSHQDFHSDFVDEHDGIPSFADSVLSSNLEDRTHFQSFDSGHYPYASFPHDLYSNSTHSLPETQISPKTELPTHFDVYSPASAGPDVHGPQPMSAFPSQLLASQSHSLPLLREDSEVSQTPEDSNTSTLAIGFNYDIAESEETSDSPPAPSVPFKSPPPTDIASRRKKVHVKPAALTADTMRRRPSTCPRTVSHADGFRLPADSPLTSPMRRIVSAGGNRGIMSGRISKGGAESAQRSPINLGGFADAGAFLERNYHNLRHPSLTVASSLNSSLAPPTPMSPRGGEMTLGKREGSWSTASPVEGGMSFIFNARVPGCFTTVEGDQNLASPPETPQDHLGLSLLGNSWSGGVELQDEQWHFEVPDEPLYTPAQESFGLEMQIPQPSYLSQPVTPAFGHFNPNFTFGHELTEHKHDSPQYSLSNHSEYSFPDAQYPGGICTSPMSQQKAFQFSNATAADFSEK